MTAQEQPIYQRLTHPYPQTALVTDNETSAAVLLYQDTDEQLAPYFPLSGEALRHIPTRGTSDVADFRRTLAPGGALLWGLYPMREGMSIPRPIGVLAVNLSGQQPGTTTVLFEPGLHGGKGYGIAARIGVMAMTYARGATLFTTNIAEANCASQRSSGRSSYVRLPDMLHDKLTGSQREKRPWCGWLAVNPECVIPEGLPTAYSAYAKEAQASQRIFRGALERYRLQEIAQRPF